MQLNPPSALSKGLACAELPYDGTPDAGVTSAVLKPQAAHRRKPPYFRGAKKRVTCGECAVEGSVSQMVQCWGCGKFHHPTCMGYHRSPLDGPIVCHLCRDAFKHSGIRCVSLDTDLMHFIVRGRPQPTTPMPVRSALFRTARWLSWDGSRLRQLLPGGRSLVIPLMYDRKCII